MPTYVVESQLDIHIHGKGENGGGAGRVGVGSNVENYEIKPL
jgi:hypothetical protein